MNKSHLLTQLLLLTIATSLHAADIKYGQVGPGVPPFKVREGFKVTLAADKLQEARFMEFDDKGRLYLAEPSHGVIVQLVDKDGDGIYETRTDFVTGHKGLHGLFFKDGWLYVTQPSNGSVFRAKVPDDSAKPAEKVETVLPEGTLPTGGGHPFFAVLVTNESMFITVSDNRNMTPEINDHKTVYQFDLDGKNKRVFATGIRNTEKLRIRPGTTEIYGFDHGSDNFGQKYGDTAGSDQPITDVLPPEELNLFTEGGFYGHPFISGNRIVRPEYADRKDIHELAAKTIPPVWMFHAHWAICGWTFISKDYFPGFKGDIFAASHGSWNSVQKVGYRVERVMFDPMTGRPCGDMPIVMTLGEDGKTVLARPVDCTESPDGTILFSCDMTKRIYRISKAQ